MQFTPLQLKLMAAMHGYRDLLYTNRTQTDADAIRNVYALHILNHVYHTRDRVLKNNMKIVRCQAEEKETPEVRDQGFTRPKVLVMLPTRSAAVRLVDDLIKLSGCESVDKKKRFQKEFGTIKELEAVEDATDYTAFFGGNSDDHFRVGIKFTRKTMKLFSEFYASDVIIASPLGLRTIIGAQGEKKRDFDFLSSIEMLVMDQADAFLMQNWDHVEHVLDHLNLIPTDSHDCDFSRVKNWYLDGRAAYVRQTLIFSDYLAPELNALFAKYCRNVAGKIKTRQTCGGSINEVSLQVQQIFSRVDCTSLAKEADMRFNHFKEKVFPALKQSALQQTSTMIFIPSYFDYVRVRNYLDELDVNFVEICEYTDVPETTRSRSVFYHGKCDFILYTERVHFYRRYRIRGTKHIFFYQLPEHAHFYPELLSTLADADDGLRDLTISALYTRYDQLRLERIVGSQRATRMIRGEKSAYMFA
ncbi:digestive organ expansion factor [Thamnocephalis sphaerospora]|uniref:U3 small nucleolar RNA-associated protein 25 n=1 Tax=Thamnocephalis sphaerospora TaxID=78915 RepID=A0A4P9XKU7_9FUNG|nr:digestive organ expansion factor [Thamnocephalis sphaerospora]|eukprot:RKP06438.1 digestive organ expansion factor [Thamnocephalis sphaerospora]